MDSAMAASMPLSTPSASTPSAATSAIQWSRRMANRRRNGAGDSAWVSAATTTPASTGSGMREIGPAANSASPSSASEAQAAAKRLVAPAASLADPAEKPAPTGIPCASAAARLASPSAPSSRLADSGSPWRIARLRMVPQLSANRISAMGAASWARRGTSTSGGSAKLGAESTTGPASATPQRARSKLLPSAIPARITSSAPGNCGTRRSASSATTLPAPSIRLGRLIAPKCSAMPPSTRHTEPEMPGRPSSLGNCLTMMVTARPKAKPRSTGREMKPDSEPSRNSERPRKMTPTIATSAVAKVSRMAGSRVGPAVPIELPSISPASAAARIAAAEEVGETIAKRLRPASA